MSYNSSTPQAADNPSTSQGQILDNFTEISTAFNLNHGNFNAATQGKHTLINFVRQTLPQSANANEGLLFAALVNGASELYYGRDSTAAVQMTGQQPSTGGGTATSYSWNFVDGLSIRHGVVSHPANSTAISFDTAFPNTAYIVVLTPVGAAANATAWNAQSLTVNGFTLASTANPNPGSFYYLAIGR